MATQSCGHGTPNPETGEGHGRTELRPWHRDGLSCRESRVPCSTWPPKAVAMAPRIRRPEKDTGVQSYVRGTGMGCPVVRVGCLVRHGHPKLWPWHPESGDRRRTRAYRATSVAPGWAVLS